MVAWIALIPLCLMALRLAPLRGDVAVVRSWFSVERRAAIDFLGPFTRDPSSAPKVDIMTFCTKLGLVAVTQLFTNRGHVLAVVYVPRMRCAAPCARARRSYRCRHS